MAVGVGQKNTSRSTGVVAGRLKMNEKRFMIAYVIQAARAFNDPVSSINHPGARLLIKKKFQPRLSKGKHQTCATQRVSS